ncbi:hypothetical protein EC973_004355 [Apophysomyces ossiformis]|uniref:Nucleolar 27S pre-rRNA processing Urb2/Npa2 C-terminal domain-containing protein n=1 Tax=Apophysomyces ossiformis TaxID=679940 RepID=A0A8H7BLD1_9FUNG|nr:hypothetical protein EC973_004355 [Apophysomyces ossiformis]
MSDLSSEKIAKALKGAGPSTAERIETATEAWRNDEVFFPNKDHFLFEWVCTALTKPSMKKLSECSLLQIAYWKLLQELLEHYHTRSKHDRKQSPPVIRVHLVVAFATLFQQFYADNTSLNTEDRIEFLRTTHSSLTILFSSSFAYSYRPAFEHMNTLVDRLLAILLIQIEKCEGNEDGTENQLLQTLIDVAAVVLERYDAQLVQAANQKKIFTMVLGDIFPRLLKVRRQLPILSQQVENILSHTLFHVDTILEYTSVLKESSFTRDLSQSKQTSYVSKLFEELTTMLEKPKEDSKVLDVFDVLPILFKLFVERFRNKRQPTSSMQDLGRTVEFGFFIEACIILRKLRDRNRTIYLEFLGRILQQMVELNVYDARNDDVGKAQLAILEEIANEIVSYLDDPKTNDQGLVFSLVNTLIQIDFSLVESRFASLWPVLLHPEAGAQKPCLSLAISLLQTYAASRQIDGFVNDLLVSLQDMPFTDVYMVLEEPLFSRTFLKEFSMCITKHMPATQATEIFEKFATNLYTTLRATGPVAKKQKRSKDVKLQRQYTARFIALYFGEFIYALRLTPSQRNNFEKVSLEFFDQFVKSGLGKWENDTTTIENAVIPALQIHFIMTNALYDVYWKKIAEPDRQWLATTFASIFEESQKLENQTGRNLLIHTANTMLQHVYSTSLHGANPPIPETVDLVNSVLDYVMQDQLTNSLNSSWDGKLIHLLDKDETKIACWKLITDEWFDIICSFITSPRTEKFASMVLLSLVGDQESLGVTVQSLNKTLLRSANFYEAKCFKDCSIATVTSAIVEFFKGIHQDSDERGNIFTKHCAALSPASKDLPSGIVSLLSSGHDAMQQDLSTAETEKVKKLMAFVKLLLLFPLEYYERSQRHQTLLLSFLADGWVICNTQADPVIRIKTSLACRSLHLRLMLHIGGQGILATDPSVLHWFMQSIEQWSIYDENVLDSLREVTKELDRLSLAAVLSGAGGKTSNTQAADYWKATLTHRIKTLQDGAKFEWTINAVTTLIEYLRGKRSSGADLDDVIYAKDAMRDIAAYIINILDSLKGTLTAAVNEEQLELAPINSLKPVFITTRLLEEYALVRGSEANEAIKTAELSSRFIALASPFTQVLQLSLRIGGVVLDSTTDFVATLCTTLSRYQGVDAIKRVLAVIWFVHSIVSKPGADHAVQTIAEAFKTWIRSLSKDQFDVLVQSFIEQSEEEASGRGNNNKVFLFLLARLLHDSTDAQKHRLQRWLSTLVLKLSLIAGRTESIEILHDILSLLAFITAEKSFEFTSFDLSLLLSCLLQIASPTAPERFQKQIDRQAAYQLFDDACSVLTNLVNQHREKLVDVMPAFVGLLQALLRSFRSTHVSLVGSKRKTTDQQKSSSQIIPLICLYSPLDESTAQRYARLLTQVSKKASGSAQNAWRIMARHAPYILLEYFTIQSDATMSIALPQIKNALIPGLYGIMDMCSENDHNLIMASLDGPGKTLFKSFYTNWKQNHKYAGQ